MPANATCTVFESQLMSEIASHWRHVSLGHRPRSAKPPPRYVRIATHSVMILPSTFSTGTRAFGLTFRKSAFLCSPSFRDTSTES